MFVLPTNPAGTNTLTLTSDATVKNLLLGDNSGGAAVLNFNGHSLAGKVTVLASGQLTGLNSGYNAVTGMTVVNAGTIAVNSGAPYLLAASNSGVISVSNSADLQIIGYQYNTLNNIGGTFSTTGTGNSNISDTYLDFENVLLVGGNIIATNPAALIRLSNTTISNATISGNVQINSATLRDTTLAGGSLTGGAVLEGTVTNNEIWSARGLGVQGNATLNGNGTIFFDGTLYESPGSLTIGQYQTIFCSGGGFIDHQINNSGTISCVPTTVFGTSFRINLQQGVSSNNGTISAVSGGQLTFQGNAAPLMNYNGTLSATGRGPLSDTPASAIFITSGNIFGGQLNTDALGTIRIDNSSLNDIQCNGNIVLAGNVTFGAVTFNGTVVQSAPVTLNGPVTNNASWTVSSTILLNALFYNPPYSPTFSLAGNGTLALIAGAIISNSNTTLFTLSAGQTIKGYGTIGTATVPFFVNNTGTIIATPTPSGNTTNFSPLTLYLGSGYYTFSANTGTFSAVGGSTFSISGGQLDNTGGIISATGAAKSGSPASLISIGNQISGGTITSDSLASIQTIGAAALANLSVTGKLNAHNGTLLLTNVALSGTLIQDSLCNITLTSGIVNNDNWTQSAPASIGFASTQILQGNGSITLSGGSIFFIPSYQNNQNIYYQYVTFGTGQTIQGSGTLGSQNNFSTLADGTFFNLGLIKSTIPNSPGLTLVSTCTNFGTLATAPSRHDHLRSAHLHRRNHPRRRHPFTQRRFHHRFHHRPGGTRPQRRHRRQARPHLRRHSTQHPHAQRHRPNPSQWHLHRNHKTSATRLLDARRRSRPHQQLTHRRDPSPATLPTLQSEITLGQSHIAGLFTSLPNMGLALIDNSALATPYTTFGGIAVDSTSILILPALLGDADLDGKVDLNDLNAVLDNFGTPNAN